MEPKSILKVPCKAPGVTDPILRQALTVSATAGGAIIAIGGTNGFPIPQNKGDVLAIDILVGSATIADLAQTSITLLINGMQILNGDSLLPFSSLYNNERRPMRITIPGGAVVSGQITNASANTIPVIIDFLFYNPYAQ